MKTVRFKQWNCTLIETQYQNGRTALQLVDQDDGQPIATATVNLPDTHLRKNEVLLKGWSENEGLPEALENAGIVRRTGTVVPTGFVVAEVAEYLGAK